MANDRLHRSVSKRMGAYKRSATADAESGAHATAGVRRDVASTEVDPTGSG